MSVCECVYVSVSVFCMATAPTRPAHPRPAAHDIPVISFIATGGERRRWEGTQGRASAVPGMASPAGRRAAPERCRRIRVYPKITRVCTGAYLPCGYR